MSFTKKNQNKTPQAKPHRKKISRKKPGEKSLSFYFDNETQESIVKWQQSAVQAEKNALYIEKILPAFSSLVENLINVYGFRISHESKIDLKNECLVFLYGVVGKFDVTKGSKAFSYFNVVAKHWLTIKSKQNAKNTQTFISIDDKENMTSHEEEMIEAYKVLPSCDDITTAEEAHKQLQVILECVRNKAKTENEILCLDAINILVTDLEDLDILSKRGIMLYLRSITKLTPKSLSVVVGSLKKYYKEAKNELET